MPLRYGGGIKTVEQALQIFKLGIEKVAISSSAVFNPNIIREIANIVGKQSVVTVIDVKKKNLVVNMICIHTMVKINLYYLPLNLEAGRNNLVAEKLLSTPLTKMD